MIRSVCLYCGSSDGADPAYVAGAAEFGRALAEAGVRLVYGGGGVGLMGAAARACHDAGGRVLGVMPEFLQSRERMYDAVETVIVSSMHERKLMMFQESDGFVVMPGGIGTLEEIVELLSWRRLGLHRKPIVFHSPGGYWEPFFALVERTVEQQLTPGWIPDTWRTVEHAADILSALRDQAPTQPVPDFF